MEQIKSRLKIFLIMTVSLVLLGTVGFMLIEGRTFLDSFYFIIVTMATVGYGDVHPVTPAGKIFALFLIVMGVGTFLGVVANATEMMLSRRELETRLEKLNMVIGVFFSEVGRDLITMVSRTDPSFEALRHELVVSESWTDMHFEAASRRLKGYTFSVDAERVQLEPFKRFLLDRRGFMLRLMENPVLLEHETFTDLLRAVFHLTEELSFRDDLSDLPSSDRIHLASDVKRAYTLLVAQWLNYMKYLKDNYPYLFSLAIRTNPFDTVASPVVK